MRKILWWICFVFFLSVFTVSVYIFSTKVLEKKIDADFNMELRESFWSGSETPETEAQTEQASDPDTQSKPDEPYVPPAGLVNLMNENKNVIGWIKIDGTDVDYPIVYNADDYEYYLKRDINGNRNAAGSIFLDPLDDLSKPGMHIIYGHHMKAGFKAGTMFRDVSQFTNKEYMNAHQNITVYTMDKAFHLRPVYCYSDYPDTSYREAVLYRYDVKDFLKNKIKMDITSENVFILLTCDYTKSNARTYLICEEI